MESTASHPVLSIGRAGRDSDLSPLGRPALILGVLLLTVGIVAYHWLDDLSASYGALVDVAYVAFLGVAVGVIRWGYVVAHSAGEPAAPQR